MNERAYLDAILPEPFKVLGLRLLPFSIGHLALLKYLEVSFVVPGTETSIEDVASAAWICSRTFEEGCASLASRQRSHLMADWARQLLEPSWLHRVGLRKPMVVDWKEKEQLLSEYISEAHRMPTYLEDRATTGSTMGAPSWHVVRVVLAREFGWSDTAIMNRPYRLCILDYMTLKAMEGRITLIDDDAFSEAQEFANQFAADFAKARN